MNAQKNHKISVLLGSGSSIPAGFPSTEYLTQSILSGDGVHRHTDARYIPNPELVARFKGIHSEHDNDVIISKCMAKWFYEQAQKYYSAARGFNKQANYEDVFYLVDQVYASELEIENPAIHSFVNATKKYILQIYSQIYSGKYPDDNEIYRILDEIRNYITDMISYKLSYFHQKTNHLKIFKHICAKFDVSSIATLCHDTHVEAFFNNQKIPISDGFFIDPENGVRYWNGSFIENNNIPFIKVHGSVNWFRFWSENRNDTRIGIPLDGDHEHTRTQDGNLQHSLNGGRPLLLIGTFNKMYDYSRGMFLDLFYHLRLLLSTADIMIICGYGFGDKGINGEISNWYHKNPEHHHFIIIEPESEKMIQNARPLIQRHWNKWIEKGSLIDKYLEDVTIEDINNAINKIVN